MPLTTVPDSTYMYVLDKGQEVSATKVNTILWQEALQDMLILQEKYTLRFLTGGGQTICMQRDSSDYKKVINRLRQYKPRTTHEYDLLYKLYELGFNKIDLILAGHLTKQDGRIHYSPEYMKIMTDFNTIIHQYEYEFNEPITSKGWAPVYVEVVDCNDKTTQIIELSMYREPLPPYDQIPDKIEKPLETIIPLYDSKGHYRDKRVIYRDAHTGKFLHEDNPDKLPKTDSLSTPLSAD